MPAPNFEQLLLPIEITETYEGDAARQIDKLCDFYNITPLEILTYGIGVLDALYRHRTATGDESQLLIGERGTAGHPPTIHLILDTPEQYFARD